MTEQPSNWTDRLRDAFIFEFESESKLNDLSFIRGISFSYENDTLAVRFIYDEKLGIDATELCSEMVSLFISHVPHIMKLKYQQSIVTNPLSMPLENFILGTWVYCAE